VTVRRAALAVCALVWIVSLLLPAVRLSGGPALDGFDVLRDGWQAQRAGVYGWYANPAFLAALIASAAGWRRTAAAIAGVGLVLALSSFAADGTIRDAGLAAPASTFAIGFYSWLAAHAALCVWCIVDARRGRRSRRDRNVSTTESIRD
jgi:hypothetical protein